MSENNRVNIEIIREPSYVNFTCPHCDEEIEMDYDEFYDMMVSDYWGDWRYEEFCCPECGKDIEIDDIFSD